MLRRFGLIVFLVAAFASRAFAAAPVIVISSPTAGATFDTSSYIITCTGTVSEGADAFAEIYLNGVFVQNIALNTSVRPATFSTTLVLVSGTNLIQVSDTNAEGRDTGSVTVTSTRNRSDLRVNMSWNDGNSDVDLYLFCPADATRTAEVIWYGDKNGANGGSLDVDNVVGYGPENISFPVGKAPNGSYTGAVNLYAAGGAARDISARVTIFLNEGTTSQQTIVLDTIVVSVTNGGSDVRNGEFPKGTNSASTKFFSFSFGAVVSAAPREAVISYPNPFLPGVGGSVTIRAEGGGIIESVQILALDGRIVRNLPGTSANTVSWDGRNTYGDFVASGAYFFLAKLRAGTTSAGRMTIVR